MVRCSSILVGFVPFVGVLGVRPEHYHERHHAKPSAAPSKHWKLQKIEEDCDCVPPKVDRLILWQSSGSRAANRQVNDHNKQFLPPGIDIHWVDNNGMLEHVWHISQVLAKCRGINGLYDAYVMLRPLAFRADVFRNAILWHYGGLWMDHKVVLTADLSTAIDFQSDAAVLPVDNVAFKEFDTFGKPVTTFNASAPVHNAILYSRSPRHVYFEYILRLQIQHVRDRFYGDRDLEITGPLAYAVALEYYLGNTSEPSIDRSISGGGDDDLLGTEDVRGTMKLLDGSSFDYEGVYRKIDSSEMFGVQHKGLHKHMPDGSPRYGILWKHEQVYCDDVVRNPAHFHGMLNCDDAEIYEPVYQSQTGAHGSAARGVGMSSCLFLVISFASSFFYFGN